MPAAILVVVNPFTAWGKSYQAGDSVPEADQQDWESRNPGTVARRLAGGDLQWQAAPAAHAKGEAKSK